MTRIMSLSVSDTDEWIVTELDLLGGSRSAHIVAAIKLYLKDHNVLDGKPFWYVDGQDYSHLSLDTRRGLVKFGYSDPELEAL